MIRKLSSLVLIATLLGWSAPELAAQGRDLDGRLIRDIDIQGLKTLPADTVLFYLGIEKGGRFDRAQLDANIHTMWNRSLIDDISVEAQPVGADGVRLVVHIEERPVLSGIEYQGLKKLSRTEINDRIAKDHLEVREGGTLQMGEIYRLKAALEDMYREKGYRFAEAKIEEQQVRPGEEKIVFHIDEGDKVRIAQIRFTGNHVFGGLRLHWAMKKTKESGPITRIFKKDVYNAATLQEDLDRIRDLYRKVGYKNVQIAEPKIEVKALHPSAKTAKGQKRRLFITVPIDEGQRWKMGDISVEGNEKFADSLLLKHFKRPRGGWLRANVLDDGLKEVTDLYHNSGYLFATATTEIRELPDHVANVVVKVDEGDQYRVGRIEFEGNTRTKDKVLRREMAVQEGWVMNIGALRNSIRKISQLDFFKTDENDPVDFDFDSEKKTVDLDVKGQEGDRTTLMLGGGWSELDGFFGQFSIQTRNFLGRGETLGASYQSGRFRNFFDLSYYAPWFLDRPQSVGLQVFKRDTDFTLLAGQTYIDKSRGATVSYGRNFGLFRSASITYSQYKAEDQRQLVATDGTLIDESFSRNLSIISPSFVYDSRDSRIEPTIGTRLSVSADFAGGALGGTTDYLRPSVSFSMFRPVTRDPVHTLFAFNVEAGLIKPFGGDSIFFLDRYYLGGENSIRGFRFRSIWVRDDNGKTVVDNFGFPLGGDKFAQVNLEYQYLVSGPFRFILFFDAGNVYSESQSWELSRLRYSTGLEMRIFVPVFGAPLRFIYSKNLDPLPDDRFEDFQFSIGTTF